MASRLVPNALLRGNHPHACALASILPEGSVRVTRDIMVRVASALALAFRQASALFRGRRGIRTGYGLNGRSLLDVAPRARQEQPEASRY